MLYSPVHASDGQVGVMREVVVRQEVHAANTRHSDIGGHGRNVALGVRVAGRAVEPRDGTLLLIHAIDLHVKVPAQIVMKMVVIEM